MRGLWRPVEGLPFGWWLVLVVVTHGALLGWGALTRARRALIASLQERADRAEAEQGRRVAEARAAERAQMAREMHDVLAHRLSLLATYAGALEYRPDAPPEQLSRAAGIVRVGVHQALEDLRKVITVLRDEDVGARGLEGLQPNLSDLSDLVEEARAAGTVVRFRDGMQFPAAAPPLMGRTAYRVVQEGLTNARKHAPGQPVHVRVAGHPDAGLEIEICNPLASQATAAAALPGSGTGLVGLTERVHLAGGRLDHQRRSGNFRLLAWLPWPA
jgi:signal transduction histidine kinase